MLRIGDFSKVGRVPVSALRCYADLGLLVPAQVDPLTGYRYSTLEQLPRLNRLLALKDLGLSLDQIGQVLRKDLTAEQLRGMLRLREAELQAQLSDAEAQLRRVKARLTQIELEGAMPDHEVVLKTIEALHVLSLREHAPTPEHVGALLGEACGAVAQAGLAFAGAPFTIFHDREFKPEDLDVEIVVPVPASVQQPVALADGRALTVRALAGLQAACLLHAGGFDAIAQSYAALGRWIDAHGYQVAGPAREVYLRAPDQEGAALTEIQWAVAKAERSAIQDGGT
jgi:DNA-binding transcriptional MerR regulator